GDPDARSVERTASFVDVSPACHGFSWSALSCVAGEGRWLHPVTLEPDQIDVEGLPRALGGGLEREPVEELLGRVQSEYAQLYEEHDRLKEELARRERATSAVAEPAAATPAPAPEPESPPEPAGRVAEPPRRE